MNMIISTATVATGATAVPAEQGEDPIFAAIEAHRRRSARSKQPVPSGIEPSALPDVAVGPRSIQAQSAQPRPARREGACG